LQRWADLIDFDQAATTATQQQINQDESRERPLRQEPKAHQQLASQKEINGMKI
jgi:hypothetical protein